MNMKEELVTGLLSTPKYIPGWYRYDQEGSRLSDLCLQENQHYYFHRCELNILKTHLSAMMEIDTENPVLVDMGSGNCQKTRFFIDEILKNQSKLILYPIDISREFLLGTCKKLSEEYGEKLDLHPVAADYEAGISELKKCQLPKVILWFGSIQNLKADDQVRKLKLLKDVMTESCSLIFSVDVTQSREAVLNAYGDVYSRQLYMNFIGRLIREEKCTIKPENFNFEVDFVKENSPEKMSAVQVLVRAKQTHSFILPNLGLTVDLVEGEPMYLHEGTGLSHKYTLEQVRTLIGRAGLQLVDTWVDDEGHVAFCKCKVMLM